MVYRVGPITGQAPWYSGAEPELQQAFARKVRAGDVVVDAGANWGLHTLYLSRLVGPAGRVVALECFSPALAELTWHVPANRCKNVRVQAAALADRTRQAWFLPGNSPTTGRLSEEEGPPLADALPVRVLTLYQLFGNEVEVPPTLIKLDVEGAECRVLRGAEAVTHRHRLTYLIELHTPLEDLAVARWLTERAYRLKRLSGPPIRRTDRGWPAADGVRGTIVAFPQGKGGD
jgi:FkbM family methyltransferase